MATNVYTTQFYTQVQTNSKIAQSAANINLSVDQKLTNYSTTAQMNSAINLKANEISSTVTETYETKSAATDKLNAAKDYTDSNVSTLSSSINQTANAITAEVTRASDAEDALSSRINLTATSIDLTTAEDNTHTKCGITIKLKNEDGTQLSSNSANVTLSGLVKFTDLSGQNSTTIDGSNIKTGKISAARLELSDYLTIGSASETYLTQSNATTTYASKSSLAAGTTTIKGDCITTGKIQSSNYVSNTTGTKIDLSNGVIDSKNFKINSSGNVAVTGNITSTGGTIGGFTLGSTKLYNGKSSLTSSSAGVYIGTDGISLGTGSTFKVTSAGALTASNANINGTISATSGTFDSCTIQNCTIKSSCTVPASTITGTLATSSIPNLSASKITSGTMSADRISGGTISGVDISAGYISASAEIHAADTLSAGQEVYIANSTIGKYKIGNYEGDEGSFWVITGWTAAGGGAITFKGRNCTFRGGIVTYIGQETTATAYIT